MLAFLASVENNMEAKDNENKIEEIDNKVNENIQEQATESEKTTAQSANKFADKQDKNNAILGALKRIIIVAILIAIVIFALNTAKYYKNDDITDKTNVIINNNNVTARLKKDIIIEDDEIYMSMKDIKNFFDNYIYEEQNKRSIITTYDENIAEVYFSGNHIKVNDQLQRVDATAIKRNEEIYLPISEMTNVYNIELEYKEETNIITMDSIKRKQVKADAAKKILVKDYAKVLSRTVDKVEVGEVLIVIAEREDGWAKVRTASGKIGYVKQSSLENEVIVREGIEAVQQIEGKISMFWDYYSEYAKAPDRTGEEYEGVNVVSPTFFYIDDEGNFTEKVGKAGENYIEWAHKNGYKVWPMFSNTEAGIKITSKILKDHDQRESIITDLVKVCEKYDIDGINIDFEYMYEKDKDLFSRFIIELKPRMAELGIVVSVDVTAPDGSPNWSLCYDRTVLGKTADYLIFMAYDQYGISSDKAGTTAGYNWVETNLKKFIETYEVPSEKIILGIPFYTRIWTETSDGEVSSKVVSMKDIEDNIPDDVQKIWNEDLKQYYIEYTSKSTTKKMWVEDLESIEAKVSLVRKYNLAGVSAWEKDRESKGTWKLINKTLGK